MTTRVLLGFVLLTAPLQVAAQPPPAGGAVTQTARAAGMALHDGTLPPGTLTARVVRGNFSGNLAGVEVTLDVLGEASKQATTGADGRAQFAHLNVGATVLVWATVSGERLESESIVMPAESGVRVLLVAGDEFVDTTKTGDVATLPPLSAAPPLAPGAATPAANASPAAETPAAGPGAGEDGVATLRLVMIALTILTFVAVVYGRLRAR